MYTTVCSAQDIIIFHLKGEDGENRHLETDSLGLAGHQGPRGLRVERSFSCCWNWFHPSFLGRKSNQKACPSLGLASFNMSSNTVSFNAIVFGFYFHCYSKWWKLLPKKIIFIISEKIFYQTAFFHFLRDYIFLYITYSFLSNYPFLTHFLSNYIYKNCCHMESIMWEE